MDDWRYNTVWLQRIGLCMFIIAIFNLLVYNAVEGVMVGIAFFDNIVVNIPQFFIEWINSSIDVEYLFNSMMYLIYSFMGIYVGSFIIDRTFEEGNKYNVYLIRQDYIDKTINRYYNLSINLFIVVMFLLLMDYKILAAIPFGIFLMCIIIVLVLSIKMRELRNE